MIKRSKIVFSHQPTEDNALDRIIISEFLRKCRNVSGLSHTDISKSARMGKAYVSKFLSGKLEPSVNSLVRLCKAMGAEKELEEFAANFVKK